MPAPTALLRRPEEVAEVAANVPLPVEGMGSDSGLLRKSNRLQIRMMNYYLMRQMLCHQRSVLFRQRMEILRWP